MRGKLTLTVHGQLVSSSSIPWNNQHLTGYLPGVLTKPDTLTVGAIHTKQLWLDILEGRNDKFPLKLGYYCTRQPDEDERKAGISNADARQAEADFFARTEPWCLSPHHAHFGTRNLVSSLSMLLTKIIDERFVGHSVSWSSP